MSKTLQTLNGQNKLVLWAGRISECHSSGQNVKSWCKENGTCEQTCYKWQLCIPGTDLLQSLIWIEQEIADKPAEERYTERLEQAKPVLDAVLSWANTRTVAPKSAPGKAFHYLKEQCPYLTNYLKDGHLETSNNRVERSKKLFVIDRKNFLLANTPKGATGSAVMFSLIQTTIENGLDPYKYLTWPLKTANNADLKNATVLQDLLSWNVLAECRVK